LLALALFLFLTQEKSAQSITTSTPIPSSRAPLQTPIETPIPTATSNSLISTTLTLSIPSTATVNQEVILSSTLKDSNQQPISHETINYTAISPNGTEQTIGTAITESNGLSSIPFVPLQAQIYQIEANYAGNTIYSPCVDSQYLSVTALTSNQTGIKQIPTMITLTLSSSKINTQTSVTIFAALENNNEDPLSQESLIFQSSMDGITWSNITAATTGVDGVAQANYTPQQTGTLLIRAVFNGDLYYLESTSNQETLVVSNGTN